MKTFWAKIANRSRLDRECLCGSTGTDSQYGFVWSITLCLKCVPWSYPLFNYNRIAQTEEARNVWGVVYPMMVSCWKSFSSFSFHSLTAHSRGRNVMLCHVVWFQTEVLKNNYFKTLWNIFVWKTALGSRLTNCSMHNLIYKLVLLL